MCIEDYRLGRLIRMTPRVVAASTTSAQLVAANPDRCKLVVMSPTSNMVTVSPEGTAVSGTGFVLTPGDKPLLIDYQQWGEMPSLAWSVVADAGTPNVQVWEGYLPDAVLAAFIKEWRRNWSVI